MHAALAGVGGVVVCGGGLVDQALLDDGAVDGEAEGRGAAGGGGCSCDEGFEDGVLGRWGVLVLWTPWGKLGLKVPGEDVQ